MLRDSQDASITAVDTIFGDLPDDRGRLTPWKLMQVSHKSFSGAGHSSRTLEAEADRVEMDPRQTCGTPPH